MKLWLILQDVNNGYDTYDSAVVCAETEDAARMTHPSYLALVWEKRCWMRDGYEDDSWAPPSEVKVRYIGEAAPGVTAGVVCASFNAG